jgi:hypothetical protein
MIRTTYRGRQIKVLKTRGKTGHVDLSINGREIKRGWPGDDAQALDWFRQIIDRIDANGGAGMVAMLIPGQYTQPYWYEPGTIDINPAGHATQPGGVCLCSGCVIDDPTGGKARYAPLAPDACRDCHQLADGHQYEIHLFYPHRYTAPTPQQQAGRQAAIDRWADDDDPDEATCDALYRETPHGYLGPPRCLYFADHRDATNPNWHTDARGFRWRRAA